MPCGFPHGGGAMMCTLTHLLTWEHLETGGPIRVCHAAEVSPLLVCYQCLNMCAMGRDLENRRPISPQGAELVAAIGRSNAVAKLSPSFISLSLFSRSQKREERATCASSPSLLDTKFAPCFGKIEIRLSRYNWKSPAILDESGWENFLLAKSELAFLTSAFGRLAA